RRCYFCWSTVVRASRRPLRGLLSMRNFLCAIKDLPHPEERVRTPVRMRVSKDAGCHCSASEAAHHTHGQWLLEAPKVLPLAKREKAKGSSSSTRLSPARMRATSLPTPVILKPWLESAIM